MNRIVMTVGVCVLLLVGAVWAGQRTVTRDGGTITYSIDGADSTGVVAAKLIRLCDDDANTKPEQIVASFYHPANMADPGDSCIEGAGDTMIITYTAVQDHYEHVIHVDTTDIPGSTLFVWRESLLADPTVTTWIGGDSTSAYAYLTPNLEDFAAGSFDWLRIDYYCQDSSGTSGNLTGEIRWWLKLIDEE